jgi:hypothetical protein
MKSDRGMMVQQKNNERLVAFVCVGWFIESVGWRSTVACAKGDHRFVALAGRAMTRVWSAIFQILKHAAQSARVYHISNGGGFRATKKTQNIITL